MKDPHLFKKVLNMQNNNIKFHPLCKIFPSLPEEEMSTLVADIKANGLKDPITILNGQILDGRNRHIACGISGTEPKYVEYSGDDPIGFVVSANIHRRHLTPIQLAALANTIANMERGEFHGNQSVSADRPIPKTSQDKAAKLTGAKPRSMRRLKKIKAQNEQLHNAVVDGSVSATSAEKIVDLEIKKAAEAVNKNLKSEFTNNPKLKLGEPPTIEKHESDKEITDMRLSSQKAIELIAQNAAGIALPETEPEVMSRTGTSGGTAQAILVFLKGYKYGSSTPVNKIREQAKEFVYPQLIKEVEDKVRFADAYKPSFAQSKYGFTKEEYNIIFKCLHPDVTQHIKDAQLTERFAEAFRILKEAKSKLIPPDELLAKKTQMPSTSEELEALLKTKMTKYRSKRRRKKETTDENREGCRAT